MAKFTIAKKLNMTSHFLDNGTVVPVTVLQVAPTVVTQIKTQEKEGYSAVQIGAGKKSKISKALAGHFKGHGSFAKVKEFRTDDLAGFEVGKKLDVTGFQVGEFVNVTGVEKGRGFTGPVKRYDFAGMPASHGHDKPRAVGSIGQRFPQHTRKGLRMAGRMGGHEVTVKNLQIIEIDAQRNLIAVKGAVPGHRNGFVEVVSTGKVKDLIPPIQGEGKKKK